MFTIECEDPNCMGCKQAAKEQCSKEGNQSTMPRTLEESAKEENQSEIPETAGHSSEEVQRKLMRTLEEVIARDMYRANELRFVCLADCNNLKARVSCEINELIGALRQRERYLLSLIEGDYVGLMCEIDNIAYNSIAKVLNRFDETESSPPKTMLVYDSDFEALKRSVASFGKLTRPNIEPPKPPKGVSAEDIKDVLQMYKLANSYTSSSAAESLIEAGAKTTYKAKNAESASSTPVLDAAALAELQIETEKSIKEVNRGSEKVSRDLKEIGERIDSRIKLHGRPVNPQIESLQETNRKLEEEILALKGHKCMEDHLFFHRNAPKLREDDSKVIVEDKVSEDPQTMSAEERHRRREMHVLKVWEQREKELRLGKMHRDNMVSQGRVNTWTVKSRKDIFPSWTEELGEDHSAWTGLPTRIQYTVKSVQKSESPETLSGQIEKRMGAIAKNGAFTKAKDAQKKAEARKRRSFEVLDLEPKKNDSLNKDKLSQEDRDFRERLHSMVVRSQKFGINGDRWTIVTSMPKKETEKNNSMVSSVPTQKNDMTVMSLDDVRFPNSLERGTSYQSSESTDLSSSEEAEKDSSLDDDIEIISRLETESIPSDLPPSPPLPPKSRFKFGGKPSCFSSLLRKKADKKPDHSPTNGAKSESSGIGESESQKSSSGSAVPSGSNAEVTENPAFQESSSECLDGSKDVDPGNNPTLALRSSLAKYLEKNPVKEWLATGNSSEQSKSAENSTEERVVPIFAEELDQWLPAGFNRRKEFAAKWRHTDCDWLFNERK